MTERKKTCGTCGPDSSSCEWLVDSIYDNKACKTLRGEYVQDTTPECSLHISYRQALERAEAAEARVADLVGYVDDWWCQACGYGPMSDADDFCLSCNRRHESRQQRPLRSQSHDHQTKTMPILWGSRGNTCLEARSRRQLYNLYALPDCLHRVQCSGSFFF